jgi:hypothetical protein
MGEGGGKVACRGGWGSLMTHCVASVTTQSTAFKYVMVSKPFNKILEGMKKLIFPPQ